MKRIIIIALALIMLFSLAGCGGKISGGEENSSVSPEETAEIMTHEQYVSAEIGSEVTVETYIQAKQGWWENEGVGVASFYTQNEDGGYFLYNMPCSEEEYGKLTEGTKIRVTGKKAEWKGEIEITDAAFTVEEGSFKAEAVDVTEFLGDDALSEKMNTFVSVRGAVVEAIGQGPDGSDSAWFYSWDGTGSEGDDLYFKINANGVSFTVTVESYLCGKDTDVYKAVKTLKVGDEINIKGFLYWYDGAQPHVTGIEFNR